MIMSDLHFKGIHLIALMVGDKSKGTSWKGISWELLEKNISPLLYDGGIKYDA